MKKILILTTAIIFSSVCAYAGINDGMVAYYPFNGNAKDASGNGNHGMVYGAALTSGRNGDIDGAYSFDGANDYIEVADSNDLDLTTALTISAWVKVNSYSGLAWGANRPNIVSKGYNIYEPYRLELINEAINNQGIALFISNADYYREWPAIMGTIPVPGVWTHIAVTYALGVTKFYINGSLIGTSIAPSITTLKTTTSSLYIGARSPFSNAPNVLNGALDDVCIYNRALSVAEVQQLYNESSTLIQLASFTAIPKSGRVILKWTTESEVDNAGFNIYRATSEDGEYKINDILITTKGSPTQGASYEFVDTAVQNRKTYYYKLEDIDLNGTSTMHGPVSATPRLIYGIGR